MKKATRIILFSLAGAAVGIIATAIVKAYLNQKIFKQAALKELLKELYPEQEWEHHRIYSTPMKIDYTAYATEEFLSTHPHAEDRLIKTAHERTPALDKIKCDIKIRPMSELEAYDGCCCGEDEENESEPEMGASANTPDSTDIWGNKNSQPEN